MTMVSKELVKNADLPTKERRRAVIMRNADGTENKSGKLKHDAEIQIDIGGHKETVNALVSDISSADVFLGYDWLVKHNPEIDWEHQEVKFSRCPNNCTIPHETIHFGSYTRKLEQVQEKSADTTQPTDLPKYLRPYTHLFNKKNFNKLPNRTVWDHEINLDETAPATLQSKVYPMTIIEKEELGKFVKENLESGHIRPSKSPYATPCFFIPKKDGTKWLVQDYKRLNEFTIKDKTPLPLISEVIDNLKEATVFNKLDIIWGYNNVRIKEGDEWKAAFITNEGLFEPTVMFFGMSNSPATFQRMMNTIFRELLQKGTLVNYMDDFVIPAKSQKELEE